jgi:hypothetical protein
LLYPYVGRVAMLVVVIHHLENMLLAILWI